MKKLFPLLLLLASCTSKNDMLTAHKWVLMIQDKADIPTEFRFNKDGSFYNSENGTPKGEAVPGYNTWSLEGDQLTLKWSGVYVNKNNTLRISQLDDEKLILYNDNTLQVPHPMFYFLPEGDLALKMNATVKN